MRGRTCILIKRLFRSATPGHPQPYANPHHPGTAEVTSTRPKTPLTTKQASLWAAPRGRLLAL